MTIFFIFFFFNDTATTEIYTLSLHDALPISSREGRWSAATHFARTQSVSSRWPPRWRAGRLIARPAPPGTRARSEEHTSELQSRLHLVCRLLLEKKKKLESIYSDRCMIVLMR